MRALACGARPPGAWERLATQRLATHHRVASLLHRFARAAVELGTQLAVTPLRQPRVTPAANPPCATTAVRAADQRRSNNPRRAQMWEARLWLALDHETPVDIVWRWARHRGRATSRALLCGAPARRLARDHPRDGPGRQRRMMLRVRVDSSASAECWVTMPQCRRRSRRPKRSSRPCGCGCALSDTSKNASPGCSPARGGAELPPTVAVRRVSSVGRRADGLLLEIRRLVRRQPRRQPPLPLRARRGLERRHGPPRDARARQYPAAGFVQSLPDFARTLLRTRRPAAVAPPPAAAAIATDDARRRARAPGTASPETMRYRRLSAVPSAPLGGGRAADDAPPPPSAGTPVARAAQLPRNSAAQFGAIRRRLRPPSRRCTRPRTSSRSAVARPCRRRPRAQRRVVGAERQRVQRWQQMIEQFVARALRKRRGAVLPSATRDRCAASSCTACGGFSPPTTRTRSRLIAGGLCCLGFRRVKESERTRRWV